MRAAQFGLSQADVAAAIQVTPWRLSRVLTGLSPIRPAELRGLADLLALPQLAAFDHDHEPPPAA